MNINKCNTEGGREREMYVKLQYVKAIGVAC